MIIYTLNDLKIYESRSDKPKEDWTGKAEYVIDETDPAMSGIISKVREYAPYFDFAFDSDGKITDVIKTGELVIEIPKTQVEVLCEQNKALQAKVKALSESSQMLEDCLVEMAEIIYA